MLGLVARFPPSSTRAALAASRRLAAVATGSSVASNQASRARSVAAAAAWTDAGSDPPKRVVVIGGGFGGLYAAIRLSSLMWPKGKTPQVTLVDKSERFTFKPLLYELLNGGASEDEVAPYFSQLLAPYEGIRFVQAAVCGVEEGGAEGEVALGGSVELDNGATLEYDYLVVGLGSQTDARGVPGVKELALPFNVYNDAVTVKAALETMEAAGGPSQAIMIVGGGYAGVELAAVVAERVRGFATVQLVTPSDTVLDGCPDGQRDAAERVLANLGVQVLPRTRVRSMSAPQPAEGMPVPPHAAVVSLTDDGGERDADAAMVLWTAGASPATAAAAAAEGAGERRRGLPFPLSDRGAIQTEPTLRVVSHPNVFALGDVSGIDTPDANSLPATAQVAFQQADYAAWNLWASINGRQLLPFRYQHLGSMMSLGQLNAAVALPVDLPPPVKSTVAATPLGPLLDMLGVKLGGDAGSSAGDGGVTVEGPIAAVLRRGAYLYRQPTNEQRFSVASGWLQQALSLAASGRIPMPK